MSFFNKINDVWLSTLSNKFLKEETSTSKYLRPMLEAAYLPAYG